MELMLNFQFIFGMNGLKMKMKKEKDILSSGGFGGKFQTEC